MFTTHRRAVGRGKSWLATALASSGLVFGVATGPPAVACHITHQKAKPTEATTSVATSSALMTPEQHLQAGLQKLLAAMPSQTPPTPLPPTITPTLASMPQALPQILTSVPPTAAPSVSNWHQSTPSTLTPPTPTSTCDNSPYASSQNLSPPAVAPLGEPGKLFAPPTPAPEPSTLVIALGLTGAFAWRLRRKSRRVQFEASVA